MSVLSDLMSLHPMTRATRFRLDERDAQRAVSATFITAFRLAARAEFVAAGALYQLLMLRIEDESRPEFRREMAKYHRQQGAKKSRERRAELAAGAQLKAQQAVSELKRQSSTAAIARKLGISRRAVAQAMGKLKNT